MSVHPAGKGVGVVIMTLFAIFGLFTLIWFVIIPRSKSKDCLEEKWKCGCPAKQEEEEKEENEWRDSDKQAVFVPVKAALEQAHCPNIDQAAWFVVNELSSTENFHQVIAMLLSEEEHMGPLEERFGHLLQFAMTELCESHHLQ